MVRLTGGDSLGVCGAPGWVRWAHSSRDGLVHAFPIEGSQHRRWLHAVCAFTVPPAALGRATVGRSAVPALCAGCRGSVRCAASRGSPGGVRPVAGVSASGPPQPPAPTGHAGAGYHALVHHGGTRRTRTASSGQGTGRSHSGAPQPGCDTVSARNGHGGPDAYAVVARPVLLVRYRPGVTRETARTVHVVPLPPTSTRARSARCAVLPCCWRTSRPSPPGWACPAPAASSPTRWRALLRPGSYPWAVPTMRARRGWRLVGSATSSGAGR